MVFQQNFQALPGILIVCFGRLVGIACPAYGYHIGEERPGSPEPVVQHVFNVVLDINYLVELRMEVILVAPGVAVGTGKLTAIIGIYAVTAPEPAIYELTLIQDGLEVSGNVFDHCIHSIIGGCPSAVAVLDNACKYANCEYLDE